MRTIHPWSKAPGLERETGRTSWYYQKVGEASFKKLTRKQVEGFYEGETPLTPNEDGFVRIYTVTLSMKDRKPQRIYGEYCTKHLVGPDGILDENHWNDAGATTLNSVFGDFDFRPEKDEAPVVGGKKMAQRRMMEMHKWRASQEDIQELVRILKARGVPDFSQ